MVLAQAGVFVLVEVRAVEEAEAVDVVRGKWAGTQSRRTPKPWLCRRVHEIGEVVGRAECREVGAK